MPEEIQGHIPIVRASRVYNVSRATLARRREKARQENDDQTYGFFILRTKAGETLRRPSKDRIDELIKSGKVPEWFVDQKWLEREFGQRKQAGERPVADKTAPSTGDSQDTGLRTQLREEMESRNAKVIEQYEKQIEDLKADKEALRQEKREALQSAQQDKQMFADAVRRLTQFLSQPAIVNAVQAQLDEVASPPTVDDKPKQGPVATPAQPSNSSDGSQATARRAWWNRFVKRSQAS